MSMEQIRKDLEEAANEYAILDEEGKWKDGGKYKGFIAGSKWQKEQMMKDAVEGTLGYGPHLQRPIVMLEQVPDIWDGGCKSVKVIVIKEDEKL